LRYKKIEFFFNKIANLVEFASQKKQKLQIFLLKITKFVDEKHSQGHNIAIYGILVETKLST
jgi:hypothetical protein